MSSCVIISTDNFVKLTKKKQNKQTLHVTSGHFIVSKSCFCIKSDGEYMEYHFSEHINNIHDIFLHGALNLKNLLVTVLSGHVINHKKIEKHTSRNKHVVQRK